MKIGNLILVLCIALGFTALSSLGFWQMKRLAWKEALIERVKTNLNSEPLTVEQVDNLRVANEDFEYRPATVSGIFDHSKEQHFFATHKGQSGYFVYTPLTRENGQIIFINRGFVMPDVKDNTARKEGLVEGAVTISGLVRSAPEEKPNTFVPDNDLQENVYYWKSLNQMTARAFGQSEIDMVPFFIDANNKPNPGRWPVGGVTLIEFPNSHLQYALTWFGLAGTLLVVGGYFLWGRVRGNSSNY